MYYYQIDAPMQMPIREYLDYYCKNWVLKLMFLTTVGFTAYDCRMVINMDDPATRREFNFITDGEHTAKNIYFRF